MDSTAMLVQALQGFRIANCAWSPRAQPIFGQLHKDRMLRLFGMIAGGHAGFCDLKSRDVDAMPSMLHERARKLAPQRDAADGSGVSDEAKGPNLASGKCLIGS
jgi:hypothetical protein